MILLNNNMNNKLTSILLEIIKENNPDHSPLTITADTHLRDDLGLDSLALAFLTVKLEDEFNVDIFEDGLIYTVGDILNKLDD